MDEMIVLYKEMEMQKTLALIHTSFVFLNVETALMKMLSEALPDVRLVNIVDDSLLADVIKEGKPTPAITRKMCHYFLAAEQTGAHAILSLCSTMGDTIDVARKLVSIPIMKIDEAMAEKAVAEGEKIGVMATVPTTLDPTIRLIHAKGSDINKQVKTERLLCEGAFQILMSGDKAKHDQMVMEKALSAAKGVDVFVLAQASMARLEGQIAQAVGKPVFSSPRLCVEKVKQLVERL
jgi:Asp/Glu/hydantoin racemase